MVLGDYSDRAPTKYCMVCKVKFSKGYTVSLKTWAKTKTCSKSCAKKYTSLVKKHGENNKISYFEGLKIFANVQRYKKADGYYD